MKLLLLILLLSLASCSREPTPEELRQAAAEAEMALTDVGQWQNGPDAPGGAR